MYARACVKVILNSAMDQGLESLRRNGSRTSREFSPT